MTAARPNILLINFDDLGYGDVSTLNPASKVKTPRIDGLARDGMTLTDAHSSSAVCTPSRYSLLTGEYNWRTRLRSGVLWGYSPPLIEPGQSTVASVLQAAGYRTGCFGKWHLGLGWDYAEGFTPNDQIERQTPPIDFETALSSGPHTLGFDRSLILPASLDMPPYCYVENGRVVDPPTETIATSPRPAMWRGGAIAAGFDHGECLHTFTRRAEAFIDDYAEAKTDTPFFMYFPAPSPHTPHTPRSEFIGQSDLGPYGDLIAESDWSVGCLLDALERHGLTEDTLVIVTSDNGAHCKGDEMDFLREYGHRSNHIYRGQKSDAWDGGHRVPMILRWPKKIAAGGSFDGVVSQLDVMATAAELAGADVPRDQVCDSKSMVPLFDQATRQAYGRNDCVHHSVTGQFAIRNERWKLICCPGSGGWSQPDESVGPDEPRQQLYDMARDPSEQQNIIAEHPDEAARLRDRLDTIRRGPQGQDSR